MACGTGTGVGSNCPWPRAMPGQLVWPVRVCTCHAAHCRWQGLLQPEALRGTPDPICFTNAMGGHGRDGWSRRAIRKSSESVPAQTDSSGVNRAVPVGIGVEVLLVLCLSQMELMVELHVDRRRDRAVTRME